MNIKKLLLLPLLALSINACCIYVPTKGPLILSDPTIHQQGTITLTFIDNQELKAEAEQIFKFVRHLPANQRAYQDIIDNISRSQSPQALQALEAYGNIIMHMYQKEAYLLKANSLPHCFPIRGIRNPFSNEKELNQLLNEYDQLATIAMKKSYVVGSRMKLAVKFYKYWYWKTCAMFATTAYILYDIGQNNQENTILYRLLHGDYKSFFRKTSNASLTNPDIPKSPERAISNLMLASEASKSKLLEKEILSVMAYKKAIKAQEEVSELANKIEDQEETYQEIINTFYQEKKQNQSSIQTEPCPIQTESCSVQTESCPVQIESFEDQKQEWSIEDPFSNAISKMKSAYNDFNIEKGIEYYKKNGLNFL